MMKKYLLLTLMLRVTASSIAEEVEIGGLWYDLVPETKEAIVIQYKNNNRYTGSIAIPESVENEGIPYNVTSIGEYAFLSCVSLSSISIPKGINKIEKYAFLYCTGLTTINVEVENTKYDSRNNCNAIIETESNKLIVGCHNTIIPNNIKSIGDHAFSERSDLIQVTIPNSVTTIGYAAFAHCSGLTSVTIGNNVTSIGDHAFNGCSSLSSLTLPNSVITIGDHAFFECSGLSSLTLPNSVTTIGNNAFECCSGLTAITIPNNLTNIGDGVFANCTGLISVTIPNNVSTIGNGAFSGCSGMTSFTIGNSITSIGYRAFYGCRGLTSITIGNSVTSIGNNAFEHCSSLQSVHISDLEKWFKIAFNNSGSNPLSYAHHLFLNGNEIKDLVIPNSITSIGAYTLSGCSYLKSITIPNSVITIGNGAFTGCSALTSIKIPNSVTSIGRSAFWNCTILSSVTIGNSVSRIEDFVFYGCSGLKNLISLNKTPPTFEYEEYSGGSDLLYLVDIPSCVVWVPKESIDAYKEADIWHYFNNLMELKPGDVNLDTEVNQEDMDALVDYVMGKDPEGFYEGLGDLNGDDYVNAADIVTFINLK